jgi:peptidyl-prolyl cis-trans isomerase B (cyclophilin B)
VKPVIAILAAGLLLGGCAAASQTAAPASSPVSSDASAAASSPVESSAPAASTSSGTTTCQYAASGTAAKQVSAPPTDDVPATGTTTVTLKFADGPVVVTLDRASAPCTVNSFISLAEQGFYDGTSCHRLAVGTGMSMLQCGDPTATGSGGPGYQFADELSGSETYTAGTVAMANAGPNTNGSQFFIVFGDSQLTPDYTVFGHIDKAGLKVIEKIAAAGHDDSYGDGTGKPLGDATIASAKVG